MQIGVEGVVPANGTLGPTRGLIEVGDVPVLLQAIQGMGHGHLAVGFQSGPPETAAKLHLLVAHFL